MSIGKDDRRSALVRLVVGGLGMISAALAGLVGAAAAPPPGTSGRRWHRAAAALDVGADGPIAAVIAERHADGWYQTRKQTVVFIDKQGDEYRALSATCAHLGCRVNWDASSAQFKCPCHGGTYSRNGQVVAGPPPRGLSQLAVRVNPQTSDIEVEL